MDRRLIQYLPYFMQDIKDMKAIMETEQDEVEKLWQEVGQVTNNQFVATASKEGVARWEKILELQVKGTEDIETRKFRILTRLNEQLPYTLPVLKQQLDSLCGTEHYSIRMDPAKFMLWVEVDLKARKNFEDVRSLIQRITPANIIIYLTLIYNKHRDYIKYSHRELKKLTHYQLRNNVLEETRICNQNKDLLDCIHQKLSNYTQIQVRNEEKINGSRNNKL